MLYIMFSEIAKNVLRLQVEFKIANDSYLPLLQFHHLKFVSEICWVFWALREVISGFFLGEMRHQGPGLVEV